MQHLFLILLPIFLAGQTPEPRLFPEMWRDRKQYILPLSAVFAGGATDGLNNTLAHHYSHFQRRFPNANDQFWNPAESWKNKYAGGDPDNGAKFPGSMTVFVGVTDGYHLTRSIDRAMMTTAILAWPHGKRGWKRWAAEAVLVSVVRSAGFHTTYSLAFR